MYQQTYRACQVRGPVRAPRASALAEARRRRHEEERERRVRTLVAVLVAILMLVAFGIAGSFDYYDRVEGAGASALPSREWLAGEVG